MNKPLIIEALEEVGPCDINTLAGHLNQSVGIVNSMLIRFMRSGQVTSVAGMFSLTEVAASSLSRGIVKADPEPEATAPASSSAVVSPKHPWRKYPGEKPTTIVSSDGEDSAQVDGKTQPNLHVEKEERLTEAKPLPTVVNSSVRKSGADETVSKAERLRNLLRDNGGEMSSREMADATGIVQNSISGILCGSVLSGQVEHNKRDNRSFYKWRGEQTAKVIAVPPQAKSTGGTGSGSEGGVKASSVDFGCSGTPNTEQCITVPASAVLEKECRLLERELIAVNERLQQLKAKSDHKHGLLEMVKKLEEHLKGAPDDAA